MEPVCTPVVAIIEDHQLLGQLVAMELERVGVGADLVELDDDLAARILTNRPSLVLLDIELGLQVSALEICRKLVQEGIGVVIFSGVQDHAELGAFLEAGAAGILSKTESLERLAEDVQRALRGESVGPSASARVAMTTALREHRTARHAALEPFERLSESEREVLSLMCDGRAPNEIAELRFVSLATIRAQIRAILEKLGVHSQLGAVTAANRVGWSLEEQAT